MKDLSSEETSALIRELVRAFPIAHAAASILAGVEYRMRFGEYEIEEVWSATKAEIYMLLSSEDPRYAVERSKCSHTVRPAVGRIARMLNDTHRLSEKSSKAFAAVGLCVFLRAKLQSDESKESGFTQCDWLSLRALAEGDELKHE
jgi:hypothetical protein